MEIRDSIGSLVGIVHFRNDSVSLPISALRVLGILPTSITHPERRSRLFPKDDDASCLLYNFLSGYARSYFPDDRQEMLPRFSDV